MKHILEQWIIEKYDHRVNAAIQENSTKVKRTFGCNISYYFDFLGISADKTAVRILAALFSI